MPNKNLRLHLENKYGDDTSDYMSDLRDYSNVAGQLILFLTKQEKNLNKYSLIKPLELMAQLSEVDGCSNQLKGYLNVSNPDWGKKSHLPGVKDYNDSRSLSLVEKHPTNKTQVITISAPSLMIRTHGQGSIPKPFSKGDINFEATNNVNGLNYVRMFAYNGEVKSSERIVRNFIGFVIATKTLIDLNIKANREVMNIKHQKKQALENKLKRQKIARDHSKYSWKHVFAGMDMSRFNL